MTWLVRALVGNGHQVRLLTYHQFDHYLPVVQSAGVEPENIATSTKVGRFWKFRAAIRQDCPDVIISFLDTPNLIGVFAALPPKRIPLIVSERNLDVHGKSVSNRIRFNSFRLASKVVTNCQSQYQFITTHFPFLKPKLSTILNCVDLDKFHPAAQSPERGSAENQNNHQALRIIVAASIIPRKNAQNLIRAVALARQNEIEVSVDWFGNNLYENDQPTSGSAYFLESQELIRQLGLAEHFRFHDPVSNIHEMFRSFDACCLPSFREGCPNVICEAMASAMPVLVSDFGDLRIMVEPSRGYRFDPNEPRSIFAALTRFSELSAADRVAMGRENRRFAERELNPVRFAEEYEKLIAEVVR
jgi:glycosyltransferase involved in cell wall biosynthesis